MTEDILAERRSDLQSRILAGQSYAEIGQAWGVSKQRVHQVAVSASLTGLVSQLRAKRRADKARRVKRQKERQAQERLFWPRFWSNVEVRHNADCWLWSGLTHPVSGYGRRGACYAHRAALEWRLGRELRGSALHRCRTPACVNPAHLYEGTQKENMEDRVRDDPQWHARVGNRVTDHDREQIIRRYEKGDPATEIWRSFSYGYETILRTVRPSRGA